MVVIHQFSPLELPDFGDGSKHLSKLGTLASDDIHILIFKKLFVNEEDQIFIFSLL